MDRARSWTWKKSSSRTSRFGSGLLFLPLLLLLPLISPTSFLATSCATRTSPILPKQPINAAWMLAVSGRGGGPSACGDPPSPGRALMTSLTGETMAVAQIRAGFCFISRLVSGCCAQFLQPASRRCCCWTRSPRAGPPQTCCCSCCSRSMGKRLRRDKPATNQLGLAECSCSSQAGV